MLRDRARAALFLLAGVFIACAGKSPGGAGGAGGASSSSAVSTGAFGNGTGGACGLGGASDAGTGCANVPGGVRFSTDVAPIFAGCTGEICHGALTYASTVGVASNECCDGRALVAPGDLNHSYLVDKIRGHHLCGGKRMPLDLPPIAATDETTLERWICEGAPND